MAAAFAAAREVSGIDFGVQEPRLRVIDDEYGRESLRFIIYWRGAHAAGGSPAGLRLDITRQGIVMFDPLLRTMAHPFSDTDELGEVRLLCYVLDEVIAEKVRAVLGQRIYSVSRDLYDIFSLIEHVDDRKVLTGLPRKMDARDVGTESVDLLRMEEWKNESEPTGIGLWLACSHPERNGRSTKSGMRWSSIWRSWLRLWTRIIRVLSRHVCLTHR